MARAAIKTGLRASGCLFGGLTGLALYVFGGIIHIVTIYIAFKISGILAAIFTGGLPVISQIYWAIKLWTLSGVFFNLFTAALIIYIGIFILYMGSLFLVGKATERVGPKVEWEGVGKTGEPIGPKVEWERVNTLEDIELNLDEMMMMRFLESKYQCDQCEDFFSGACEGEGYTTYNECYSCMKAKFENGDRGFRTTFE